MLTRKEFIGLGSSAMLCGACCSRTSGGAVRLGVISDTHVIGPESAPELERALRFFAERDVDAVIHCGDVTDLGYLSQLDVFFSSWRRVMPPGTPLVAAFDKGGGRARDLVFGTFRTMKVGPHHGYQCNAIVAASAQLGKVSVKDYALRRQPTYRIACETEIFGKRTVVVETHLDLSKDERTAQIAELVAEFASEEHVIVSGDFNVDDASEFRPFFWAGFAQANCGGHGTFPTHRRRRVAITPAIDNVLVKGFDILSVRTEDDPMILSDHRMLVCRLRVRTRKVAGGAT